MSQLSIVEKNEYAPIVVTPMDLIARASASDASIEKMEQLFALQLRWEENEAKRAYHQAVADFKAESTIISKDKKVGYTNKDGSFTGYTHATIGHIIQTIIPIMSKFGLSHSWDVAQSGQEITVTCHLTHSMGHSSKVTMSAGKDDSGKKNLIQQVASTVTYLERYTLLAITGMAASDQDDDGKSAENKEVVELITESQVMDLLGLIKEVKADEKAFCTYFKVDDIASIPKDKFKTVIAMLEAKRRK